MTARITPAVPSGRRVTLRSPRSAKVYISLLTTSVDSPTPRANRPGVLEDRQLDMPVAGKSGGSISPSRTATNSRRVRWDIVGDPLGRGERLALLTR